MIVAGNSNVACLDQVGARLTVDGEPAEVQWVGALRLRHFFDGHPAAARVRERFARAEPRLLAIGTHDVFDVCAAADRNQVQAHVEQLMAHADALFAELSPLGVAWLVFPQPRFAVRYANLSPDDIHTVAVKVNRALADVATRHGVAVIDAFDQLGGAMIDECLLGRDRQHLNRAGAARLAHHIGLALGREVAMVGAPDGEDFDPQDEQASFCGMLWQSVGLGAPTPADLPAELCRIVAGQLAQKGLDMEVTPELELVESGLLDSLDLVDVYTQATRAAGIDVPFDVSLRELGTVDRMAAFLRGHLPSGPVSGPRRDDFARSLAAASGRLAPEAADDAHQRIAAMSDELAGAITTQLDITLHGVTCPYGAVLLWLALYCLGRGDVDGARALLETASGSIPFPVTPALIQHIAAGMESPPPPWPHDEASPWMQPIDADVALRLVPHRPRDIPAPPPPRRDGSNGGPARPSREGVRP